MWREMIIFAHRQTHNQADRQILNSKTEAHSYPLWTVGERANYQWFVAMTRFATDPLIYSNILKTYP